MANPEELSVETIATENEDKEREHGPTADMEDEQQENQSGFGTEDTELKIAEFKKKIESANAEKENEGSNNPEIIDPTARRVTFDFGSPRSATNCSVVSTESEVQDKKAVPGISSQKTSSKKKRRKRNDFLIITEKDQAGLVPECGECTTRVKIYGKTDDKTREACYLNMVLYFTVIQAIGSWIGMFLWVHKHACSEDGNFTLFHEIGEEFRSLASTNCTEDDFDCLMDKFAFEEKGPKVLAILVWPSAQILALGYIFRQRRLLKIYLIFGRMAKALATYPVLVYAIYEFLYGIDASIAVILVGGLFIYTKVLKGIYMIYKLNKPQCDITCNCSCHDQVIVDILEFPGCCNKLCGQK